MGGCLLMPYIWNDYTTDKFFVAAKDNCFSPYTEVWNSNSKEVQINIIFRLAAMYPGIEDLVIRKEKQDKNQILFFSDDTFNLLYHLMVHYDYLRAINEYDIFILKLYRDILIGVYGTEVKDGFEKLQNEEIRFILLKYFADYICLGGQLYYKVLKRVFGKFKVYYQKSLDLIRVYIPFQENDERKLVFSLINYLFLELGVKTSVMWKNQHIGIIDYDASMIIDSLVLD